MSNDTAGRMKIVFLSHTAPTGVFRVGSHHLSREMARAGHDVAHVSTPVSLLHALMKRDEDTRARLKLATRPRKPDSDGVVQIVPIVPLPLGRVPALVRRVSLWLTLGYRRSSLRRRWSNADVVFVDQPLLESLATSLKPKRTVYRPTDAHYDPASRAAEVKIIERAAAVVAMSPRVIDEVLDGIDERPRSTYFENGVDFDRFAVRPGQRVHSRVVYLGALDRRFDWVLVKELAAEFPQLDFDIIGPLTNDVPDDLPSNLHLRGGVPYERAPEELGAAAIGMLPFSDDPGNEGRSPMKYYEYLAAGLYVVARESPTLRAREAPGVWLYQGRKDAPSALRAALEAASLGENSAGRETAAAHSWRSIAGDMLDYVLDERRGNQ